MDTTPWPPTEIVEARRAFRLPGFATLADVGFDGPWVTPSQITARSPDGPVFVGLNWVDDGSAERNRDVLERVGYLPTMPFNKVLDQALALCGLERGDIYITQAFHLLPATRSGKVSQTLINLSFDAITRHEVSGRMVIALGRQAMEACRDLPRGRVVETIHPSARGHSLSQKACIIAESIRQAGFAKT